MTTLRVPVRRDRSLEAFLGRLRHRRLLRTLRGVRRHGPAPDAASLLRGREDFEAIGELQGPPEGARLDDDDADGVPVQWLDRRPGTPGPTAGAGPQLFYVHGGAYAMGSIVASRHAADTFVASTGALGLVVEYRLAPEHPYPAALDDVERAWHWLVARRDPTSVVLVGESAGGGLALALLARLRDAGAPMPAGAVTLSAWADLALAGDSYRERRDRDLALDVRLLEQAAHAYVGDADATQPDVSPVHADPAGLPPLLLVVGTEEVVLDDTLRFHERALAAGVDARLLVGEGQIHCFTGYARDGLPAAREAVEHVAAFVREVTRDG